LIPYAGLWPAWPEHLGEEPAAARDVILTLSEGISVHLRRSFYARPLRRGGESLNFSIVAVPEKQRPAARLFLSSLKPDY